MLRPLALLSLSLAVVSTASAQATLEYIGHACFAVESPAGTRVVIDPFNSNRWLGYHFPADIRADAVLVTHPHYDHDADYYFPERIPRFRLAGSYRIRDVEITGVKGKHADPYGREFGQQNTLWLVETGGLRIAHLGDTGPLSPQMADGLGKVDVLLIPVDDDDHILTRAQITEIRRRLQPKIVIPMHYRLTAISDLPRSVGPIDTWLSEQERVDRHESHRLELAPLELATAEPTVTSLRHHPRLRPWSTGLRKAWELRSKGGASRQAGDYAGALDQLQLAREFAPGVLAFTVEWAETKAIHDGLDSVAAELASSLRLSGRADREYAMRGHVLLSRALAEVGDPAGAERHAQFVIQNAWRHELVEQAKAVLSGLASENAP